METATNKPVHEIKVGAIKCAIWENKIADDLVRHSVTLARLYKDGEQGKQSGSFGRDDLLIVARAATAAFDWIAANQNQKQEAAE